MENRKKFYANYGRLKKDGTWSHEAKNHHGSWAVGNLDERFERICRILKAYNEGDLDWQDVKFVLKNAFVSKVYVSCGVVYNVNNYPPGHSFGSLSGIYKKLIKDGELEKEFLNICEIKGTKGKPISIEHVVPGEVYMKHVIQLFENNKWNIDEFKKIFDVVSICLVTENENKRLNKWRNSMPNANGDPDYYQKYPFARYDAARVKIWKQCNQPCPGAANCPQIITP